MNDTLRSSRKKKQNCESAAENESEKERALFIGLKSTLNNDGDDDCTVAVT